MKNLNNPADREEIASRLRALSPGDAARWGRMSVHQMVCHLNDSYRIALGEKHASPASGWLQRTLLKEIALNSPLRWAKGFPTRPEVEQGKGGSVPVDFHQDLAALLHSLDRFCDSLPTPCTAHPVFGPMSLKDWMRWGYLHPDHHLRQFGR
ncbi:MAG TPA: DinB family protein [Acidobacteriaceae bacterium]|nr:DinB family protein [Acidobacteriaceae bacterium]